MIRFGLICSNDHEFDGWFGSNDDFDRQLEMGLLECPVCATKVVTKSLMTPAVGKKSNQETTPVLASSGMPAEVMEKLRELRDHVVANADDVGSEFPEEARKIHYGEAEARGIYGQANRQEVEELLEEGVEILPLPQMPDDAN